MSRIYRIHDTQRFIFLALLFPLMPLLLAVIHPSWTSYLFACELCFVVFTFWMLWRPRELEVGDTAIRIDRHRWQQLFSHEDIYEITFTRNHGIHLRLDSRTRYIRVTALDYERAIQAMYNFAWRHAIPVHDKRPRPGMRGGKGNAM